VEFMSVRVVLDVSLQIYGSHLRRWLLLRCALCALSTTTSCLSIATSSRTTSLIFQALVMEGREDGGVLLARANVYSRC
jgi:hypothetical protein